MNWDAIGAIAELLGAVGVIASLVYLATQIRQSREQLSQTPRAMRADTYQQFYRGFNDDLWRAWTVKLQIEPDHPAIISRDDRQGGHPSWTSPPSRPGASFWAASPLSFR